jgi:hypothetical protein
MEEGGRQDRRQMLADADPQLPQLFERQFVHQLIDRPPKRPVPDSGQAPAGLVLVEHAPSVWAMKTTRCT